MFSKPRACSNATQDEMISFHIEYMSGVMGADSRIACCACNHAGVPERSIASGASAVAGLLAGGATCASSCESGGGSV